MNASRGLLLLTTATGLAALAVAACQSTGSPQDQSAASALWAEMEGYREWGFFPGHEGWQDGKSPHGKVIRSFINRTAASAPANPPVGSIVVKENFGTRDEGSLKAITVMQRIEGFDEDSGDWFWARFKPTGEVTHAGKVATCSDCHFDAGGDDFVFLND